MDKMLSKSEQVGRLYADMSQELLLRMIQRIKQRGAVDLQSDPYLWHLDKLRDMHALNESNIQYVIEQTGIAREIIDDVLKHEGLSVYEDSAKRVSKDTGKPLPSYNGVKDTLNAYASQAFLEVDNLVNQTLLSRNIATNPVMRVYQDILTKSVSDVVNGLRSPEQAVNRAVMDWVNKGIPSGFIDKAGRTWSIDSYVNSVMTSTTYRVYNEMRTQSAKDLGVDTFHMSAHSAARPNCAPIQGHIVTTGHGFQSKDKDVGYVYSLSDYGYGRPDGTLGINCRHVLTPFVIGVNELPDEDIPSVQEAIANGKKQAQQRSFERGIREARQQLEAAKALGDRVLIDKYQNLLNRRQGGLKQLLNENDFLHQRQAKLWSGTIKKVDVAHSQQTLINKTYEEINMWLGKEAPTFDEYIKIRRDVSAHKKLIQQTKDIKHIMSSTIESIKLRDRKLAQSLWYSYNKEGISISGHATLQAAGRMRKPNGQFNFNAHTISNIMATKPNYVDSTNGRKVRYVNKIAIITTDDERIVTVMKSRKNKKWEAL